ncbi:hypothetical protein LTR91_023570 [Friedmanniomyces endolithicus]|uniref:Uncharacterized protein n=1 Tax=Friedmanniomyces endolithicus TaxID=329885 RepID=A0AAN6K1D1_9PEZI|nr:hypothetical protein LTR57_018923 [Friedmanniomyces endolithicus]KAK0953953.1 hypothetical protein LTR91_023570 [Friedmanniomyces endolithicus]KAK1026627.1 hypothetical protein LTS16_022172 [Friedmanniomyces endolithicus]
MVSMIQDAGATIVNGTELPYYKKIVSPDGWNWDYGTTRGYPNESEYTYVKVDFYNNIAAYLSELSNTNIRSLADIVQYNIDNDGTEHRASVQPSAAAKMASSPRSQPAESWIKHTGRRSPSASAQRAKTASTPHCTQMALSSTPFSFPPT